MGESSKFLELDVNGDRTNVRISVKITPSGVKVGTFSIETREALPTSSAPPPVTPVPRHPLPLRRKRVAAPVPNPMTQFTVTEIKFANTNKYQNLFYSHGTSFEAAYLKYLTPIITYDNIGSFSGRKVLDIKIINPNGSLNRTSSSPSQYSYKVVLDLLAGEKNKQKYLPGWSNDRENTYSIGIYTCEIWSDGKMLRSAKFSVIATIPPITITGNNVVAPEESDALLNTAGVSIGSSFATPLLVFTIHGTFAPRKNMYLELGLDIGSIFGGPNHSTYYSVDGYYSLYPFVNIGYFMPFTNNTGGYVGTGVGHMFAEYTFGDGTNDVHSFALNLTSGFIFGHIDISYTLRPNFAGANNKLSIGFVQPY
jgi:hypothetical protein